MVKELFEKLDSDTLLELWPNYLSDERKIESLSTTNIVHANIAMNGILEDREKSFLERMFFGEDGWYKRINGDGMIRLKLAAMSLQNTNDVFTFDANQEDTIKKKVLLYSREEQILAIQCYMKQKVVSYVTMRNYLQKVKKTESMTISLYRGIPGVYFDEKYLHLGLECWTTDFDAAAKFTGGNGYVLHKDYPITNIFAGCRSTFKNRPNNMYRHNGFYVRREREIIVENMDRDYRTGKIFQIVDGELV